MRGRTEEGVAEVGAAEEVRRRGGEEERRREGKSREKNEGTVLGL